MARAMAFDCCPQECPVAASAPESELLKPPLHALHLELGARMVPFAGYSMRSSTPPA